MRLILFVLTVLCISCKSERHEEVIKIHKAELEFQIQAELGEGPLWDHINKRLFWVDILGQKLHMYDPATGENTAFQMPSAIGTVVAKDLNSVVVALVDGIYVFDLIEEELELLSDVEAELTGNRFNDGKCDPNGNLWVGSMPWEQGLPTGNLYRVDPKGEAIMMKDSVSISNGIVWSSDAKTMYYIDSPTSKIMAFDFNPEDASISNERVAVHVSEEDGTPDGMAIDENDNLWVGLWNGDAIAQYDPRSGKMISKVEVPAHNVTACAFGGPDLDILYITTAFVDTSPEELETKPLSGSIFKVKPGVKGINSPYFGISSTEKQ